MKYRRLDFREMKNPDCLRCTRVDRKRNVSNEVCTRICSALDELPVRCVGEWAYDKIYRLVQYFGIFSQGMKNKWAGLNYIEICSGPGRCVMRNNCDEIDGTALAIINHKIFHELKQAVFVDIDPCVVMALNSRIKLLGAAQQARGFVGDYNDVNGMLGIVKNLETNCLNLVFVDPTECDVPFTTIKAVVSYLKNVDILINVALGTDVNRNFVNAVLDPAFSETRRKYERFLGIPNFCIRPEVVKMAQAGKHSNLRRTFVDAYIGQLAAIGYGYTDINKVKHYYDLLFASKSPKGLEFWMKANQIEPDNQRRLF